MPDMYICGPACHLPDESIRNEEVESNFQFDGKWIQLFAGTKSRHLAVDFERWQPTETLASLAADTA